VSPRSEEFMEQAEERLAAAREALAAGHSSVAVSVAYYAMLNAARAALSEDDEHARTHAGTWNLFRRRYVVTDAFDQHLFASAHQAQEAREQGDYEAVRHSDETASGIVESAALFISAVERMID
jgi:uncharacterized protein (UPF0332 family)